MGDEQENCGRGCNPGIDVSGTPGDTGRKNGRQSSRYERRELETRKTRIQHKDGQNPDPLRDKRVSHMNIRFVTEVMVEASQFVCALSSTHVTKSVISSIIDNRGFLYR